MKKSKPKGAASGVGEMHGKKQFTPKELGKTLIRLFSYFKYNKWRFLGALLMTAASSAFRVATSSMLSPVIDAVAVNRDMGEFVNSLLMMGAFVIVFVITQYLGSRGMAVVAARTTYTIRRDLFEKLKSLPIPFFDKHGHGEIMSSFTNDVEILNQALEQSLEQILTSLVTVLGTFIMMLLLSPILTLVVVVCLAFMMLSLSFIGKRSGKFFRARQEITADMNDYVEEMMSAQKVVKVFNYEARAEREFQEKSEAFRVAATNASTYGVLMMPVMGNLSFVMYSIIAMLGALLVIKARMSIGNIAAFLQFTRMISRPITQVSNQMNSLLMAFAGAERIFAILDESSEIMEGDVVLAGDCVGRKDLCWIVPQADGSVESVPVRGDIRFHDVCFGYEPDKPVLKHISLYAKPGQKIAFVGSTGAGKTTITNLINRFYEIDSGLITIDGIDLKRVDKTDLRSIMGFVLQEINLFEGTIAENIRYGKLDATDEEVVQAAMSANAHDFISKLEDGYETVIGPGGGSLSQGEQQLLSIARAAIADPIILIMDEATSSVDTRTESHISKGMDALMAGRTTFVIAHRLSTVRDANAIMVLEQGEIVERGDHDDLMEMRGRYYQLNTGVLELD
ncbi:MAG: ABC transporter ATP-binding protein [Clostridiales bacterium]|nr:ABC transporter ATP-binding protein [Clostridiales bacterium]